MSRVFYGWWIVLACWAVTLYGGGAFFFGFSAFFKPISEEFGWSRALTAGAISLSQAEGFIEGPIVGPLVDKFGPRKLMLFGVTLASIGFLALSIVNGLLMFYLVYVLLLAIGFNTGFFVAAQAAVANWFIRKRSRAPGPAQHRQRLWRRGDGSALIAALILAFGWRVAALFLGVGLFAIGIPLAFIVRHRPEQYGYLPDNAKSQDELIITRTSAGDRIAHALVGELDFTIWEALRTPVFWMLAVAFGLRTMAISATVVHQIPFLTDAGISQQAAAGVLALMGLMSIPGRIGFGILGDYFNKRYLLAIAYLFQAAGILILLTADSLSQVVLFTVVFGVGWGAPNLLFAMRADYFGRKYFATIAGAEQSIVAIGTVIGPVYAGLIYDINQSYQIAFITFVFTIAIGAVICFFSYPPKPPERLRHLQQQGT